MTRAPAAEPATLPARLRGVFAAEQIIETHISWVFLTPEYVYKVKKPVDLGFLDFRTLARRRHFCEEEVRLNRRLAPDTYLGVKDIKKNGRTVEVAVWMRRLPAELMLDRLVAEGRADTALMERIGRVIADFHAAAAWGRHISHFGSRKVIERNWRENFAQTHRLPPEVLRPDVRDGVRAWVTRFLRENGPRFTARIRARRIRDCHGDLQAQHICCTEPIRIYDCIEFNHRFRYGDTASEIAFLAMDLDVLGRPDLAMDFVNAYLDASGDYPAVALLDFYRAYRAWVRGKVLGMQGEARYARAHDYFALAAGYAAPRPAPRLVVMTGLMGSGKTAVARRLSREDAIIVRTDAVRRQVAGVPWHHRGGAGFGEGLYTPDMTRRTYARCLEIARELLSVQWSAILDGVYGRRAERDAARGIAKELGVSAQVLWCDPPEEVLRERLRQRAARATDLSEGREDLLDAQKVRYERPEGEPDVVRVSEGASAAPSDTSPRTELRRRSRRSNSGP
jgi:aminoglycoside phosphotransferase family enzyme/predicted kinase